MESKKFLLQEKDIPTAWYNIVADMENKPLPPLNPKTKEPLKPEDLYPLFAKGLVDQEMNQTDAWIEIPEEVRDMYKIWRPTPLVRAYGLEKALDTPAHIYFKNESVSPVGSHKLNSAIPQAYFCKKEGVTNVTTETGAGQWGASMAMAAKHFGLELAVYMVKVSYNQKPYRRSMMQTFGAEVIASPSMSTRAGRDIITKHPNYQGSLGTAISEAVELAMQTPNCKYVLGSVLNHVMLHQTVIGLEAEKQMEMAGEYPDGLMDAVDIQQLETFKAATLFAQSEGIIPAPESSHAIAAAIREAEQAKIEGKPRTILFNLSGHGLIDMAAYDQYLAGDLTNYEVTDADVEKNLSEIEKIIK